MHSIQFTLYFFLKNEINREKVTGLAWTQSQMLIWWVFLLRRSFFLFFFFVLNKGGIIPLWNSKRHSRSCFSSPMKICFWSFLTPTNHWRWFLSSTGNHASFSNPLFYLEEEDRKPSCLRHLFGSAAIFRIAPEAGWLQKKTVGNLRYTCNIIQ